MWPIEGCALLPRALDPGKAPDSLCGKSSALKTLRQKCAPRSATPVGLSRLPSMSSLSSVGSLLSSCNVNQRWFLKVLLNTTSSRPRPTPRQRCIWKTGRSHPAAYWHVISGRFPALRLLPRLGRGDNNADLTAYWEATSNADVNACGTWWAFKTLITFPLDRVKNSAEVTGLSWPLCLQ